MTCGNKQFDFTIKRGDTAPPIVYNILGCENIDISSSNILVTVSMWANSNLAYKINSTDTEIKFKNNYNITAADIDNYILLKKYNSFEYLKILSVDYDLITVSRSELSSVARDWDKGVELKIIKFLDVEGEKEVLYNESMNLNGELQSIISAQNLVYRWNDNDTVKPGEYFMEFKASNIDPPAWTRKFPTSEEGVKIQIIDNNLEI